MAKVSFKNLNPQQWLAIFILTFVGFQIAGVPIFDQGLTVWGQLRITIGVALFVGLAVMDLFKLGQK